MIPERDTVTVDSTVAGESVDMRVADDALAHIMNILTDMYADPELACIREYSTNALDSHVQAGQTKPIEVSTPTAFKAMFTVRDYGTGLDADDIRNIYSQYGASTKRATNDAVGMLGIGCKSALAYVDQFTVVGFKDGVRIAVSVSRDDTGAGKMTVLETSPTDEPNGAEIQIPAKRDNSLEEKSRQFFAHWTPGTVLLDGEPPAPLEGRTLGDSFTIVDADRRHGATMQSHALTVVMGNVPYPAPSGYENATLAALGGGKQLVARVSIGTVSFAPSREALQDGDRTAAALDAVLADFAAAVQTEVDARVTNAPTAPAAAAALVEAKATFGHRLVTAKAWRGKDVPDAIGYPTRKETLPGEAPRDVPTHDIWRAFGHRSSWRPASERTRLYNVPLADAVTNVWVLGYDNSTFTKAQRVKLDAYLNHHGMVSLHADGTPKEAGDEEIFMTEADHVPGLEWLDGEVRIVKWEDVRSWRDPNKPTVSTPNGARSYAGTYPGRRPGVDRFVHEIQASEIAESKKPVYWVPAHGKYSSECQRYWEALGRDCYVLNLTSTRRKKFVRTFPDSEGAPDACEKQAREWLDGLSVAAKDALALRSAVGARAHRYQYGVRGSGDRNPWRVLAALDAAKIDDPDLAALATIAAAYTGDVESTFARLRDWLKSEDWAKPRDDAEALLTVYDRYALLGFLADSYNGLDAAPDTLTHIVTYVNAAFAAESE